MPLCQPWKRWRRGHHLCSRTRSTWILRLVTCCFSCLSSAQIVKAPSQAWPGLSQMSLSCQDEMVAAEKGFCWGVLDHGGECAGMNFQGVTDVYSTGSAFLALNKATGKGFCWGSGINGGECAHMDFRGITDVYSTGSAFLALNKVRGKGTCWGDAIYGGECAHLEFYRSH